jgi:hypothetical protein
MTTTTITTIAKMVEALPEAAQDQVLDHLREYLEDLQDELEWNNLFNTTQPQLIAAAQRAKKEIAKGLAKPMDYDRL